MAFFTEEEKKKFTSQYFSWEDGKTYNLTVEKRIETDFASGKEKCVIITTDQDTGETVEHRNLFGLMNALRDIGDGYKDENTVLTITAHWSQGKEKPNKPGEFYDAWKFDIRPYNAEQVKIDKAEVAKADKAMSKDDALDSLK